MINKKATMFLFLLLISNNFIHSSKLKTELKKSKVKKLQKDLGGAIMGFFLDKITNAGFRAIGDHSETGREVLEWLGLYDRSAEEIAEKVKQVEQKVNNIAMSIYNIQRKVDAARYEQIMFKRNNYIHKKLQEAQVVFDIFEDLKTSYDKDGDKNKLSEAISREILIWGDIHFDEVRSIIVFLKNKTGKGNYPEVYHGFGSLLLDKNEVDDYVKGLMIEDYDCVSKNLMLARIYNLIEEGEDDMDLIKDFERFNEYSNTWMNKIITL